MKVPLTYRPPSIQSTVSSYVDKEEDLKNIRCGVPDSLSFDRILEGGTCPPLTTREFMNYLTYVEHSAENLQFLLWFRDYQKRFDALPESEKALAPEWTETTGAANAAGVSSADLTKKLKGENVEYAYRVLSEAALASSPPTPSYNPSFASRINSTHAPSFNGTTASSDPFGTPPSTSGADTITSPSPAYMAPWASPSTPSTSSHVAPFLSPPSPFSQPQSPKQDYRAAAAEVFSSIHQKWQPFTIQPFRIETAKIVALYLHPQSPRELNISSTDRTAVLKALTHTTHPSSFAPIARHIEWLLRRQAHPNFIRWSISNANPPRVWFARGLGIAMVAVGFGLASALFADRERYSRWARAGAGLPFWLLGMATFVAGLQGMCVVLHGLHHRQLRPWELWPCEEEEGEGGGSVGGSSESSGRGSEEVSSVELKGGEVVEVKEVEGGKGAVSYESVWREKYEKRFLLRRILDREERVQEEVLRRIQDVIFLQSVAIGVVFALVFAVIYCVIV